MAITSGIHNFGVSETIDSWQTLANEISGQTFTGDVTFIQTSNLTAVSAAVTSSVLLNGFTLTIKSSISNLGDPTVGFLTNFSSGVSLGTSGVEVTGPGNIIFDGLSGYNYGGSFTALMLWTRLSVKITYKNCLFYGLLLPYNHRDALDPITDLVVYNCAFDYFTSFRYKVNIENSVFSHSLEMFFPSTGSVVRNSILYNINAGSSVDELSITCDHNVCVNSSAHGVPASSFGAVISSIASQVVSIDFSNSNYLKLTEGTDLNFTGTAPQIPENTYGIRGNVRPHSGLYSIGADEGTITPVLPTLGNLHVVRNSTLMIDEFRIYNQGKDLTEYSEFIRALLR